ncbi:MAG: hypothetical protein A2383_00575 [Candidatus Pacebacteria bacterium RIFOXYB1_FULL_39_46]|nr:MAG: hypothetical protein A2182_00405 [Candidatus Pacebacteria bacterium RIFOXYA1_FULL_38_18]OGJ38082.1 MAG: hypothetical protein A2383_00575 [Candidatus Pacebacteria bacterium RIFOXYB1_FULL_39_46]OGJ39695.1 MAG: hypothetical protein A2411_02870 [Candidatus Pacebacteria bacterium RIFOXYC1_FULL_39_21]OGJ39834.1 MAG: hypothetical protein A2582_00340 [Candidatus Pacebacteria bacterium RIFOXYD1_FULL_39_27]
MKNRTKGLLVAGFLIAVFLLSRFAGLTKFQQVKLLNLPDHSIIEFQIRGKRLIVEVVNTPESRNRGLSGRERLETDGMLFVFDRPQIIGFWMKEMKFPIDIIWLNNNSIVGLERNIQPPSPDILDEQLEKFLSPQPANMVLETNPFLFDD